MLRIDLALFVLVCALVLFAPLAFGATQIWSRSVLQIGACAAFLLWAAGQVLKGELRLDPSLPFIALGGCGLVVGFQYFLGGSAYPYATATQAVMFGSCVMLFTCATHCFGNDRFATAFATILVAFGAIVAVFAIVQGFSGTDSIYWVRTLRDPTAPFYGPYVNRNHYAGLMEMIIPLALLRQSVDRSYLTSFAALVMIASVVLSQSRGGLIAVVVQLGFILLVLRQSEGRRSKGMAAVVIFMAAGLMVAALSADAIGRRLGTLSNPLADVSIATRLGIASDTLPLIKDRWLTGWGLGTFSQVYPAYRTQYDGRFVNAAHSDYLQLAAETGIVGLVVFLFFLFVVLRIGINRAGRWGESKRAAVQAGALTGAFGIMVHSLFDFNLQIPANAAIFFVLCALAVASRGSTPRRRVRENEQRATRV